MSLNWLPTENEKDEFISSLGLMGNFIIMDEERDDGCASRDAGGTASDKNEKIDGVRKHSFTEKLTGVKNSKADHMLKQMNGNLSREQARQLRLIHDNKSMLRHEYKLMQFDKKKNTLEIKKRCNPYHDYSVEEAGVVKSEQYLKEPVEGWYLQKRNALRRRSVGDATHVTPVVAKARESLRQSDMLKQLEQYRADGVSLISDADFAEENIHSVGKRPRSKSVSLDSLSLVSSATSSDRHQDKVFRKESPNILPWTPRNPTIDIVITDIETNEGQKVVANGKPIVKVSGTKFYGDDKDSKTTLHRILHGDKKTEKDSSKGSPRSKSSLVITPRTILANTPAPKPSKGKPHVSFKVLENNPNSGSGSNIRRKSIGQVRPHSEPRRRSTGGIATVRPVTHEMLQRESTEIKQKMNKFFQNLENTKKGIHTDDEEPDIFSITPEPTKRYEDNSRFQFCQTPDILKTPRNLTAVTVNTSIHNEQKKTVTKSEGIFAIILDDSDAAPAQGQTRKLSAASKWKFMTTKVTEDLADRVQSPSSLIRKESPDHNVRRNSIVSTTGSDVSSSGSGNGGRRRSSVGIPSHSLERSNRHSATFKLRKLVNELMKQKTRYELNELEEVKRKQAEAEEERVIRSRSDSFNSDNPLE